MLLAIDRILAGCTLSMTNERCVLLSFLFHGLFEEREKEHSVVVDQQQGITVEMLRQFVGHFLEHSYEFVSPESVLKGLPPGGKYVLLTFDDGYYNNVRALPVLEAFRVPAVFLSPPTT